MRRVVGTLAGILVMSGWVVAAGPAGAPTLQDAAKIEAGKTVYAAHKCGTCHKIGGAGSKSDLAGVGTKLSEADIRKWIVDPVPMHAASKTTPAPKVKMKPYKMSPADLDALVAYMLSLKK